MKKKPHKKESSEATFRKKLRRYIIVNLADNGDVDVLIDFIRDEELSKKNQEKIDGIRERFFNAVLQDMQFPF